MNNQPQFTSLLGTPASMGGHIVPAMGFVRPDLIIDPATITDENEQPEDEGAK